MQRTATKTTPTIASMLISSASTVFCCLHLRLLFPPITSSSLNDYSSDITETKTNKDLIKRRGDEAIETKYTLLFQPVSKIDASCWLYLKKIDDKCINQIWLLAGPVFLVLEMPWRSLCPRPRQDPDQGASRSCKNSLKTCLGRYKKQLFHLIPFSNFSRRASETADFSASQWNCK